MVPESRDALTQLLDRASLDRHLSAATAEASRLGGPLSVVMADIDHFKKVNDTHGHQAGDGVLATVAGCIASVVRSKGECFRYGGEEFLLLLPNHSLDEAIALSERARLAVESGTAQGTAVTASFGIACLPQHGNSPEALVRAADEALYDAKRLGRNVVRIHGEPDPVRTPAKPKRKEATAGEFTEDERRDMRRALLRYGAAECPRDGAVLGATHHASFGSGIREYFVICPGCGLHASLTADDA
jgi:diguanylate cyclase (GGDEF)-like protein